jgi:hypothetical protein
MNRPSAVILFVALSLIAALAAAQQPAAPTGQKTLAATMGLYAFPAKGQSTAQQNTDEAACYTWAVQNTGTDPFELQKKSQADQQAAQQAKAQASQAGKGSGAAGAVGGAAVGALIGEIADNDPGKGAAYGAAAGLIAGRRKGQAAQKQATAQADAQAAQVQQATAAQMDGFKKAFSVCLEAKEYLVKY